MGLLKKLVKFVDNPLTRAIAPAVGLGNVSVALSAAAGNQAAVNAAIGASGGATYQAGTPVVYPSVIGGSKVLIGNSLFPSLPGITTGPTLPGVASSAYNYVTGTRKRRRMNPANIKAARRAIRRIRSTRRVLQRIERLLPTRTVHSRRK